MKKMLNKRIFLIFTLIIIASPYSVDASTVYIDSDHTSFYVGDNVSFDVRINSENKNINAVEGNILLNYSSEIIYLKDVNISGSSFSLWPNKPTLSDDNKNISFVGGTPSGLNSEDAILFKINLNLKDVGKITLTPSDISVYLNDGEGTKDTVDTRSLVIDILPRNKNSQPIDDWGNLISSDKTPPEPFEISMGQDDSVFDGKKFISFNAIDNESGIKYYEVIESNLPPVRSGNTYILQEQDKSVKIIVTAFDAAGNTRESVYNSTRHNIFYPAIIILLLFIFVIYYKKIKNVFIKK